MAMDDLYSGQLVRLAAKVMPEYGEAYARWSGDAEFMRLLNTDPAQVHAARYFEHQVKEEGKHRNNFTFAIRSIEGDKLIGEAGLDVTWNHQHAWLGIGIGEPDYRGKGYGTDAVKLLVNYGFRELGLHRVQLGLFGNNPRARRCYEKAGFQLEVVNRAAIYRDGVRHDNLIMGILRPEWEALYGQDYVPVI